MTEPFGATSLVGQHSRAAWTRWLGRNVIGTGVFGSVAGQPRDARGSKEREGGVDVCCQVTRSLTAGVELSVRLKSMRCLEADNWRLRLVNLSYGTDPASVYPIRASEFGCCQGRGGTLDDL